jgi:serine/threonine-protein kinase
MSLAEGAIVGNYRILGKLGEGGMGTVYRAVDTMIQREVAIKALRPDIAAQPDILERFRSEAVLLAKLNNPAIAQLYAFFSETGQFYMVMEYVAGDTLERVIQRGQLEWQKAFSYLLQILDGISHAHSSGILHRDIKPSNVMLTPAGKIKLMDFGIAQALGGARMTRQGRIIGTLEYLAPERIQGKTADARSDLYSVGVMLFEMLSGRLPFQSDSEYELLQAHIQQAPPTLNSVGVKVPADIEAIMLRALEKDPANRYADAEEFAAAVAAKLPVRRTDSRPIPMPDPMPQPLPVAQPVAAAATVGAGSVPLTSKPMFWVGSAVGLAVLAGGIFFGAMRQSPPQKIADSGQPAIYTPPPAPAPLVVNTTPIVIDPPKSSEAKTETPAPKPAPRPAQADVPRTSPAPPVNPAPIPGQRTTPPAPVPNNPVERTPEPAPAPAPVEPAPTPVATRPAPIPPPPSGAPSGIMRLADIRTIYVSGAQGGLDAFIREEIGRQMGVRMRVVSTPHEADAVMRVTLLEEKGGKVASAGRIFGVKDKATVRAMIVDPRSNRILWQQGAGDHKPIGFRGDAMQLLAGRIVKELRDAYGR